MPLITWFGFSGYPEIIKLKEEYTADTRPGRFIGRALCATVKVGSWSGVAAFSPGDERANDFAATLEYARQCVDYHRGNE